MGFKLVSERRLTKDEIGAYRYLDQLIEKGLPRRNILRLIGVAGIANIIPAPRLVSAARAAPINPWKVVQAIVRGETVAKGNKIPADVVIANPDSEFQRARVLLEYKLPSGLSGQQGSHTVNLPPGYEQTFFHDNFVARELGESEYEAIAGQGGKGEEIDTFDVV